MNLQEICVERAMLKKKKIELNSGEIHVLVCNLIEEKNLNPNLELAV